MKNAVLDELEKGGVKLAEVVIGRTVFCASLKIGV